MIAQKYFNLAAADYEKLIEFFKLNCKMIQKAVPDFSERKMMGHFDMILQALLIKIGFSDFELDKIEIQFIKKITNYMDILDGIEQIDFDNQIAAKNHLEKRANKILDTTDEFFLPIATIDAITPEVDLFEIIIGHLKTIIACFIHIDGEVMDCEKSVAAKILQQYIYSPYIKFKESALQITSKNNNQSIKVNATPHNNSLKSLYEAKVKKN